MFKLVWDVKLQQELVFYDCDTLFNVGVQELEIDNEYNFLIIELVVLFKLRFEL